ncbi:serine/threonine-protein kinase [Streptomyces fulvoviolaceus]|uniref:serine/threonine-protein kinase n=1 Tax=Streptomyces fulvoviolaceus TaxID=285535 RepID=UPI0021C1C1DB|nr:serine/threonine-protein kinase [Streptomyces fulvoviolaceus]MCT9084634.1 serine/threonine protein kinase [Streptomyces fulvoviolaceus]
MAQKERVVAGRYRLRQRLGSGGGGDVWLAEDEELRVQVAVKEIDVPREPDAVGGDPVGRGRKEALKAAQLREHPNVITVYDVVEDDGRPWIVMEYLPGTRDLRAVVTERGPLPSDEVTGIGSAALDALCAGHRLGIIHRDVKPSNILLAPDRSGTADRRVLLTDYGISLWPRETRVTQSGMVVGTPGFVAPERLSGGEATAATDLFSLGVTLYFAVEGTAPFERDTLDASLMAALTTDPDVPQRASDPLSRVVMGLLAKDPAERLQAEQARELLVEATEANTRGAPSATLPGLGGARAPAATPGGADIAEGGSGNGSSGAEVSAGGSGHGSVSDGPEPGRTQGSGEPGGSDRSGGPVGSEAAADSGGAGTARSTPGGARRVPGRLTVALLTLAAVLVGGGGFALGAVTYHDEGATARSPEASAKVAAAPSPTPSPTVTRSAYPYGRQAGLRDGLTPGQCVDADWKDGEYKGRPGLKLVDCHDDDPEGQVIVTVAADDTASASGTEAVRSECTRRTAELRGTMADPVLYVLTPEPGQSEPPASACLLFLKNATLGGPIGAYRKSGDEMYVTQLGTGDCFDAEEDEDGSYTKTLVSCDEPHHAQVVGWAWASGDGSSDSVDTSELCDEKYGVDWARGEGHEMWAWTSSDEDWETGFRYVLCAVSREDEKKLPAGALKPAY